MYIKLIHRHFIPTAMLNFALLTRKSYAYISVPKGTFVVYLVKTSLALLQYIVL